MQCVHQCPTKARPRGKSCSATHLPHVMRPNRRPAGNACCRVLSLTACMSSLGQSQTPTALAESDCTKAPWGIARRSIDEPYLRAELETATGVTETERSLNSFSPLVSLHEITGRRARRTVP